MKRVLVSSSVPLLDGEIDSARFDLPDWKDSSLRSPVFWGWEEPVFVRRYLSLA